MTNDVSINVSDSHRNNEYVENLHWLQCNVDYFKTRNGILKLVQLFVAIICMTLVSPAYNGSSHFFLFVCVINFIATTLWSFIYLLGIREVLVLPIDWILTESVNNVIATLMYAAAFIIQLSTWVGINNNHRAGANIIGAFFGLLNALAYAATSYYLYLQYKYDH